MIICPRCGYQAPDGSPWCPRCGYGCPYPIQYQQQPPQQMPVPYQPQPIPAQYDVIDIPPQPDPVQTPKRKNKKKKKKKLPKWLKIVLIILGIILLPFVAIVVWAVVDTIKNPPVIPTKTPTPTYTATFTVAPTDTPIPSDTPVPTNTPVPTDTPVPTNTPTPLPDGWQLYTVKEGENCWSIARDFSISEESLKQANGMDVNSCSIGIGDQLLIPPSNQGAAAAPYQPYTDNSYASPNTGIRGSVVQDTSTNTCAVKGSKNKKYHCKNSPNYNTMKEYTCFSSQAEAEAAGYVMSGNQGGWCAQ